jgi:hypothetical protein
MADIQKFIFVKTAFRESHYKGILKALEKEGLLKPVDANQGRRAGMFPDPAMVIHFVWQLT